MLFRQVPIPFAAEKPVDKPLQQTHLTNTKSVLTDEDEKTTKKTMFRTPEDKSGVRKSALNMSSEDAKNKAAADEEVAKRNSRRLGTVSSLLNRFKESEPKEEPITYKRSSYLQSKEVERPKKQYNIIKPSLDDNFDEQMEAIRAQMKSGSSQFESHLKDLSKGITMTSEDMKKRTEEEKKKIILDSVSGVFSKADEEKARWKEKREAETEKELAKIDEGRKYRREKTAAAAATMPKTEPEKPAEPKRTPTYVDKPKIPKEDTVVVNEDNYDLLEAATNVATRRRKSLVELQAQRQQQTTTKSVVESNESTTSATRFGPKGDGAVATKIRHVSKTFFAYSLFYFLLSAIRPMYEKQKPLHKNTEREKPLKRYVTRRKTQEIVNESAEPKMDQMFSKATSDRINTKGPLPVKKRKRLPASKIWISDLTDIDKIYKMSEIRDITASANE
ncbi:hypothetical protein DICVIV_00259 [Dictyocaulus viviparus]|uniref:Uncharacterized protein n=1 Tax=Dictyocaulus viviparus TaxID=29172 RepID=A0A0D8YFT6_DICVI|nr:hypothetical protein DICVIV_00259 [Dictyocaulus viviparus]